MIPLLIIILGSVDLGKAIVSSKDEEIKKSTTALIKRIAAGLIIFFLPTVVYLIFNMIDEVGEEGSTEFTQCAICLTSPSNCK